MQSGGKSSRVSPWFGDGEAVGDNTSELGGRGFLGVLYRISRRHATLIPDSEAPINSHKATICDTGFYSLGVEVGVFQPSFLSIKRCDNARPRF